MMAGCSEETDKSSKLVQFKILQIDSCEYLKIDGYYGYAHKGNCKYCKERKEKEMEKLVEQIKEK